MQQRNKLGSRTRKYGFRLNFKNFQKLQMLLPNPERDVDTVLPVNEELAKLVQAPKESKYRKVSKSLNTNNSLIFRRARSSM